MVAEPEVKAWAFSPHLALAAFLAISFRCSGVSFSALALPPFTPPKRPRATAWGLRVSSLAGVSGSPSVAPRTISEARTFRSRDRFGFLLECSGIIRLCLGFSRKSTFFHFWISETDTLPPRDPATQDKRGKAAGSPGRCRFRAAKRTIYLTWALNSLVRWRSLTKKTKKTKNLPGRKMAAP